MTLVLAALVLAVAGTPSVNSVCAVFERMVKGPGSEEHVQGFYYFQAPHKVTLDVRSPVRQLVVFDGNTVTFYYPVENKAFRVKSRSPVSVPFLEALASVQPETKHLAQLGYTLSAHEFKGDTLVSRWQPPPKLKKALGALTLRETRGRLISFDELTPKGQLESRTSFANHVRFGSAYFPLEIRSESYLESESSEERVTYSNVEFNCTLPKEIASFSLPKTAILREVQW